MKITFLGTSAGESYPAIWCDCKNCTYARQHGGKNLRMNTGSMIDNDILLDMNSCGFYTAARLGVSLTGIKHLLVTHPHEDHLTWEPLDWRRANPQAFDESIPLEKRFSPRMTRIPTLTVYGNLNVRRWLVEPHSVYFTEEGNACMRFCDIHDGKETVTEDDLSFIPVAAIHGGDGHTADYPPEQGSHAFANSYIIRRGGKTLLYALDTGGYKDDMLALILSHKYDGVVMEGTFGLNDTPQVGHMNTERNIAFRKLLLEKGCIEENTPVFITHMAPHWTPPHDLYAPMMAEKGFIVAYDGLTYEI